MVAAPKNKWYLMKMLGKSSAEIFIYSDIGQPGFFNPDALGAKQFMSDLASLGKVDDLTVRINSYGGEIFDGTAIYYGLLDYKASKTVVIDGIAASQASVVAMAADPGKLKIRENAFLMIHEASMGVQGTKRDFARYGKLLAEMEENAIKAYQRHAKDLSKEELQELINDESWLNAKDAKTYGLVDEIIEKTDVDEPATNTGKQIPINLKRICFNSTSGLQKPVTKGDVMHKCPHCGKDVAEGLQFCGHCGKAMNAAPVDPARAAHEREVAEAKAVATREASTAEQKRIIEISSRCDKFNLPVDFKNELIAKSVPVEEAIVKILDKIGEQSSVDPDIRVQKDDSDKFRASAKNSIIVALGREKDKEVVADVRKNPGPRDLHSLTRACLAREGRLSRDQIDRLSNNDLAGHAIRMAGMGTSDLPAILADTMNKEFMGGFEEAPSTFQEVCAETENPNFMTKTMSKLSGFSDIEEIPEGMNFKQGKFFDKKETIALSTFGKMLTLTRQLIINNDTSAISLFPRAMSTAMKRKMNMDFYDMLTYNTLVGPLATEDGVAVFDYTAHNNLKATSGVPSVSSIGAADQMLMEQKLPKPTEDAKQTYLQLAGTILLTGTANMMTVRQLLGSQNDPAATNGKLVYNPYYNAVRPVFDSYLQAKLTAASKTYGWYWFAGPQQYRNWLVAYLSGNRTPTLRNEPSRVGEALGISYDIFFDYAFGIEDYRGVILNDGA
jgi:ATP-dependent protease ClpP protease subunit